MHQWNMMQNVTWGKEGLQSRSQSETETHTDNMLYRQWKNSYHQDIHLKKKKPKKLGFHKAKEDNHML